MVHELKIDFQYLRKIYTGEKTFEVRFNDRNYQVGDYLYLRQWIPETNSYGMLDAICAITYVLDDPQYCKEGYVILGIRRLAIAREDVYLPTKLC